jgi:LacI family transcriptional regulator
MKKVTLTDISGHLGLSKFSVSRALSGRGGVSPHTRDKVLQAARELGYDHPALGNSSAEAPADKVLLLIPRDDALISQYWMEVIAGAEDEAVRLGYGLVTRLIGSEDSFGFHSEPAACGLIMAGRRSRGLLEPFMHASIPITLIGPPNPGEKVDAIQMADWDCGYLVGEHLGGLGHRVIAYVTDAPQERPRNERYRGMSDAMAGLQGVRLSRVPFDRNDDATIMLKDLLGGPNPPTALFCASDFVAYHLIWSLSELGIKVPEEISVVGASDLPAATRFGPQLTTIRHPMQEVGVAAMQMLDWRIRIGGPTLRPRRMVLVPEFIQRATTGPVPQPAPARATLAA